MMGTKVTQSGNEVKDGDIVAGNKTINNHFKNPSRLAALFEKLKSDHQDGKQTETVSENLQAFQEQRDVIGLEQKLKNGNKDAWLDDAQWLKEKYFKKLTKYQFFEPAQEIHAYLLSHVHEKFRNLIYPKIQNGCTEEELKKAISDEVISPIMKLLSEEGCNDIMGIIAADIEGMIYFLTGQCHIKWN